jgi:hypothetical protein
VDIATSGKTFANSTGMYSGRNVRAMADVRVPSGQAGVNQVVTRDVRESTEVTTNQSTLQSTQTSADVAGVTSTITVRSVESSGGDRRPGEVVDVTALLESGGVRESAKDEIVREFMPMEETTQASTQHTMQTSSEIDVMTSSNTVGFVDSETYGGQGAEEAIDVTIVSGGENVLDSVTGTVQKYSQETQSSTQLTMQTSADVDVTTSTTRGTVTESPGTCGGRDTREIVDVTVTSGGETEVRESVTGNFVQESTGESTDSTAYLTIQTSSELAIAQQTTQSEHLITDSDIPLRGNTSEGSRGPGRDGMGQQIVGKHSSERRFVIGVEFPERELMSREQRTFGSL